MLKPGLCFYDSQGRSHPSARAALLHELADIIGYGGASAVTATALAVVLFDRRGEIERAFAEFDAMTITAGAEAAA